MSNQIIVREIVAGQKYEVKVVLGNGYERIEQFDCPKADAVSYANGIRQGLALALNAIGFVPGIQVQELAFKAANEEK